MIRHIGNKSLVRLATAYDGEDETLEVTIPESFDGVEDNALDEMLSNAREAFDALYSSESASLSEDDLVTMTTLADAVERITAEMATREERAGEARSQADALAARVHSVNDAEGDADEDEDDGDDEDADEDGDAEDAEGEGEVLSAEDEAAQAADAIAASASARPTGPISITLHGIRGRQRGDEQARDRAVSERRAQLLAAGDLAGYSNGEEVDIDGVVDGLNRKATGINTSAFMSAARTGRQMRTSYNLASIRKPFTDENTVRDADGEATMRVLEHASNEANLPQGSLTAAGGWCAPSETIYDLCELESRDGILSLPEVMVTRGGINYTQGPDFGDLFTDVGFCFTEEEAEEGDYDGDGGDKPCFTVPCPEFDDERLNVCGVCVRAGILQNRAYPELTARVVRGVLVGHEHRVASRLITSIVAGSDVVNLTGSTGIGATAPILGAIELQVEDMRYRNRMARTRTIEAILPYWVRGVIRTDLAKRLGVDLLSVPDSRIDGWFRERGIAPQFIYNWQDLGGATAASAWPGELSIALYPSGTWVRGSTDIISMGALFDSTLLATNDFSALFTEEGWLLAKMCHDSRVITLDICGDGATASGESLTCTV